MFESITTPLKIEVRDAMNYLIVAAAIAQSAAVAFMFGAVAIFIGVHQAYGPLYASLAELGYGLLVSAAMIAIILVARSKARKRAHARAMADEIERDQEREAAPPMWKDPGVVASAIPILLKAVQFGRRNKTSLGLVAAGITAALGAWQATRVRRPKPAD